jgi:hypothetical protein
MRVLDHPIQKQNWARQSGAHNGIAGEVSERRAEQPAHDAGPWEPAVRKIVEFQHLGDNWDGLGAPAPTRELLASAIGLAYMLYEEGVDPPHSVVPGLDGSVNFEWQDPDGTITEIEIDRPLHAEVMMMEPGKPPRFWTLPTD